MPFFIKWDDAEFGLRASRAGHATVSLPGAAVWHVPWTDKDDSVDWQAYFHARNRLVAALLHSRYDRGGRLVRESLAISVKHVLAMQYSAAALRLRAVQDVLAGPADLHPALDIRLGEVRALRAEHGDARVRPDAADFAPVRTSRPRRQEPSTTKPTSRLDTLRAAAFGVLHQVGPLPPGATEAPEREVASPDAGWWTLARLDSALVATSDGTGLAWLRRDRTTAGRALADAVRAHRELLRRWPELSSAYRSAVPDLVGEEAWRRTLGLAPSAPTARTVRDDGDDRGRQRARRAGHRRGPARGPRPPAPADDARAQGAASPLPRLGARPGLVLRQTGRAVRRLLRRRSAWCCART